MDRDEYDDRWKEALRRAELEVREIELRYGEDYRHLIEAKRREMDQVTARYEKFLQRLDKAAGVE
jgi:hypothetical protein